MSEIIWFQSRSVNEPLLTTLLPPSDMLFNLARHVVSAAPNGDPNALTYSHTEKNVDGNDRQMCVSIQKREGIEKYPQVILICCPKKEAITGINSILLL